MTKVWIPGDKWKRKGVNVSKRLRIAKSRKIRVVSKAKARTAK